MRRLRTDPVEPPAVVRTRFLTSAKPAGQGTQTRVRALCAAAEGHRLFAVHARKPWSCWRARTLIVAARMQQPGQQLTALVTACT